ncbi:REP-associated tyrosine transposase [Ferrimonas balearica]|uniref:REP-associated tyrosine transposase n=1 Tax=Ferrimonas balearica TaxID=44012 RepID=UPI001F465D50|nr:transposase [Ferrimonas balearica]MBY6018270.1 transposase [Halomonas denitrificans]MBY6094610.1 transposase [Ferrimonas balearica]
MSYRRVRIAGATYFLTIALRDRDSALLLENVVALRRTLRQVKHRYPFHIDAMVVLPDHIHAIWTMPKGDADYSTRVGMMKAQFSRALVESKHRRASHKQKREKGIWQRRFWEHWVRDEADFKAHVDYIHINPVKHGLVSRACDWPYSSIHRYIREGLLPEDWATDMPLMNGDR